MAPPRKEGQSLFSAVRISPEKEGLSLFSAVRISPEKEGLSLFYGHALGWALR
jgi:hypothetical protein